MKKILFALLALLMLPTSAALAKKQPHVVVNKPVRTEQVPLAVIPVLAVFFDMARRTTCDPNVAVSTGVGDPGFDPKGPSTGNFLIPAVYRSECAPQPRGVRRY